MSLSQNFCLRWSCNYLSSPKKSLSIVKCSQINIKVELAAVVYRLTILLGRNINKGSSDECNLFSMKPDLSHVEGPTPYSISCLIGSSLLRSFNGGCEQERTDSFSKFGTPLWSARCPGAVYVPFAF